MKKIEVPGEFRCFSDIVINHYGKDESDDFTWFLINQGILYPNGYPKEMYASVQLNNDERKELQYFWVVNLAGSNQENEKDSFIVYVSDFGFHALTNLYHLKNFYAI